MSQFDERSGMDEAAIDQHGHAVAEVLDLGQDVRDQQHAAAPLCISAHDLAQQPPAVQVQPFGRLIQHQQVAAR